MSKPAQGSRRSSYGRKIAKAAVIGAGAYAGYKVIKYIQELLQTDVGQLHWYKAVKSNFEVVMFFFTAKTQTFTNGDISLNVHLY